MIRIDEQEAGVIKALLIARGDQYDLDLVEKMDQRRKFNDETLLDVLVKLVSGRFVTNRVSNATVKALRGALLTPKELVEAIAQDESFKCAGCAQELSEAEMVSVDGTLLYCAACVSPLTVRCPGHGKPIALPEGAIKRIVRKTIKECAQCANPERTPAPEVQDGPDNREPPVFNAAPGFGGWLGVGTPAPLDEGLRDAIERQNRLDEEFFRREQEREELRRRVVIGGRRMGRGARDHAEPEPQTLRPPDRAWATIAMQHRTEPLAYDIETPEPAAQPPEERE